MPAEKKLSITLSHARKVYSTGSIISGTIHLTLQENYISSVEEIRISLVCKVDSTAWKEVNDMLIPVNECTTLMQKNQTLWARRSRQETLPKKLPFKFVIPELGFDQSIRLPPSFSARWCWRGDKAKSVTFKTDLEKNDMACVRYYVDASILGSDFLGFDQSKVPFIFIPRNPYLLDMSLLPDKPSYEELKDTGIFRRVGMISSALQKRLFFKCGTCALSIWVPNIPTLPQRNPLPVFVCLVLEGLRNTTGHRTSFLLPTAPQFKGVQLFLQHRVRITAKNHTDMSKITRNKKHENILNQVQPYSSDWKQVKSAGGRSTWQKAYIWKGLCQTYGVVPNFSLPQISLTHHLVARIPISGVGNDIALTSESLDIGHNIY